MAHVPKHACINGGTLITDLKTHFFLSKTKKTVACIYGVFFISIAFTIFLAFSPSPNSSSSPFFSNLFTTSFSSDHHHTSPILSYLFLNSSIQEQQNGELGSSEFDQEPSIDDHQNQNSGLNGKLGSSEFDQELPIDDHQNQNSGLNGKVAKFLQNQTRILPKKSDEVGNGSSSDNVDALTPKGSPLVTEDQNKRVGFDDKVEILKNFEEKNDKVEILENFEEKNDKVEILENFEEKNVSGSDEKNGDEKSYLLGKQGIENMVKGLVNCNLYDGNWVKDETYPLYEPDSCLLIDEQFNCFRNGRPDHDYYKLKWKPKGCTIPRLNATHMLELLRGKRLAYVGDSLNRNMWESLVCILRNSVKDRTKVFEENGRATFKGEASYAFLFEDYNFRVEFFASPFLVQQWEVSDESGGKKETLRIDLIGQSSEKYKKADFLIFNTGHWWTHDKTSLGKDYYQEGSHVHSELNVLEAFRRALTTWGRWIDSNVNPLKTHVMFRGYSAAHFSGGQWNSGGQCDSETEPIKNETYLTRYPSKMTVLEEVLKNMKVHVSYLNVSRMTDFRKDGHPSLYRKPSSTDLQVQDCSHWCLPGVPDTWNELLYAELLRRQIQNGQH